MTKQPAVYILASQRNGTLYIGVTSNLQKRAWEHKNNLIKGFTKKYGVHRLVYYELHQDMMSAITREKQMKKWNRAWKVELIEQQNPDGKGSFERWIPAFAGMSAPVRAPHQHGESPCRSMPQLRSRR
jgi:putative endonuclease